MTHVYKILINNSVCEDEGSCSEPIELKLTAEENTAIPWFSRMHLTTVNHTKPCICYTCIALNCTRYTSLGRTTTLGLSKFIILKVHNNTIQNNFEGR